MNLEWALAAAASWLALRSTRLPPSARSLACLPTPKVHLNPRVRPAREFIGQLDLRPLERPVSVGRSAAFETMMPTLSGEP